MSDNKNNNNEIYGVEKFEGSFDKEELGVTLIPNRSINEITNLEALGLYIYLLARPPGWKINVKQLQNQFQCGRNKIYELLTFLLEEKFISRSQIREKGKFAKPHYRVHLRRFDEKTNLGDYVVDFPIDHSETRATIEDSPRPCLRDTVIGHTYKTKKVKNKEDLLNPFVDFKKSPRVEVSYKDDPLFMDFYKTYPNKQKPAVAYKAFLKLKPTRKFVDMLLADLHFRIKGNWAGRDRSKIPHPSTYLNSREWEGEIYEGSIPIAKKQISNHDTTCLREERTEFGF